MATELDHPLVRARLTRLRDAFLSPSDFRRTMHELAALMLPEITRHLPEVEVSVQTPLGETVGTQLARPIVLVPILRAGLGLLEGMLHLLPEASVGHIGMERDERTSEAFSYYLKLPPALDEADVIVLDPMLATAGSAIAAVTELKSKGAINIYFACIIAAPEGIEAFELVHPDVPITTAIIDSHLDEKNYIVPGLGDAGDRYFGTV